MGGYGQANGYKRPPDQHRSPGRGGQGRCGVVSGGVLSGDNGKEVVLVGRLTDRDAGPAMVGAAPGAGRSQDEGRDRGAGVAGSTGWQIELQSAAGTALPTPVDHLLADQRIDAGGRRPRYRCLKKCSGAVAGSARAEPKGSASRGARPSQARQGVSVDASRPGPAARSVVGGGVPGALPESWMAKGRSLRPKARAALLSDARRHDDTMRPPVTGLPTPRHRRGHQ